MCCLNGRVLTTARLPIACDCPVCAVFPPISGRLPVFACCVDVCVCNFNGSFMIACLPGPLVRLITQKWSLHTQISHAQLIPLPGSSLILWQQFGGCGAGVLNGTTNLHGDSLDCNLCSVQSSHVLFSQIDPIFNNFGFGPEGKRVERRSPPPQPQVIVPPIFIETTAPAVTTPEFSRNKQTKSVGGKKKKNKQLLLVI